MNISLIQFVVFTWVFLALPQPISYASRWHGSTDKLTNQSRTQILGESVSCEDSRLTGDYNCDGSINLNDFETIRRDYNAGDKNLKYFEFWRRAMFAKAIPTPTLTPTKPMQLPTPSPTPIVQSKQQLITEGIQRVSRQNIVNTVTNIADDDDKPGVDAQQTRYSNSGGNQVERAYIKREFENMGYTVTIQSFSAGSVSSANIIARLNGKNTSKYYALTAHMDTTAARSGTNDPAPGADDNGSGTSAVIEAARVLSSLKGELANSVEFILFSGEEQGLYGSDYYASRIQNPSNVLGVINMDMIGWNPPSRGDCVQFGYIARNGGNVLADAAVNIDKTHNIQLKSTSVLTNIMASDHAPFVRKNIKAIFASECALMEARIGTVQPNYHSVGDVPNTLNYSQIEKTAKTVVGTIIELAY